jgi:hypothetical protein
MDEKYLKGHTYGALISALAVGGRTPDEIKIILGEIGNIWPESIAPKLAAVLAPAALCGPS